MNVIVGGDGKCEIDLDEYDVPYDDFSVEVTSGDLSSGSYSFDGYQTLEELKKNYVDEVADEFDCEWDVSGKLEAVDLGVTSDYLCSYSSDRLLTDSDVEGYLNANYSEYNLTLDVDFQATGLVKYCNVHMDSCYDNFAEKFIDYLRAVKMICNVDIVFVLNLKQYFSIEELKEIYKHCFYTKLSLMNLEGIKTDPIGGDRYVILDKDLCILDLSY